MKDRIDRKARADNAKEPKKELILFFRLVIVTVSSAYWTRIAFAA
jgi:hypothetical protein